MPLTQTRTNFLEVEGGLVVWTITELGLKKFSLLGKIRVGVLLCWKVVHKNDQFRRHNT